MWGEVFAKSNKQGDQNYFLIAMMDLHTVCYVLD